MDKACKSLTRFAVVKAKRNTVFSETNLISTSIGSNEHILLGREMLEKAEAGVAAEDMVTGKEENCINL